jgi:hypothetical protein
MLPFPLNEIPKPEDIPQKSRGNVMYFVPKVHTPTERAELANQIQETMLMSFSAIQAFVLIRDLKETLDLTLKSMVDDAAAQIHGKKDAIFGAQVATMKLPGKYDYSGDPIWRKLAQEKDELDDKLKQRQEFLRKLDKPMADTTTGEIIPPAICLTEGGETIKVTFPKGI